MDEIILKRLIIDIYTEPIIDKVYSGICLVANTDILMFLNYDEDNDEFDGFTIIKNKDFKAYQVWEKNEYKTIKNNNSQKLIESINVSNFSNIKQALINLSSELIAIYTYENKNSYYVGQINSINENIVELRLINENSEWINNRKFNIEEVSYIGFRTSYERQLKEKIVPNKK